MKVEEISVKGTLVLIYLRVKDFFRLARRCSGSNTKHNFHLMNWHTRVFGSNLVDYVPHHENYSRPGFSLGDRFRDRKGVLHHLLHGLTEELRVLLAQNCLPSLVCLDVASLGPMDISEIVLSQRYLDDYMKFMFANQPCLHKEWTKQPFSVFSRNWTTCDVSFAFNY